MLRTSKVKALCGLTIVDGKQQNLRSWIWWLSVVPVVSTQAQN